MALGFLVDKLEMRNRSASADAKAERVALENEVHELKHQLGSQRKDAIKLLKGKRP